MAHPSQIAPYRDTQNPSTNAPLFSSGAEIVNCEYATHAAQEQHSSYCGDQERRLWSDCTVTSDMLSIEPHEIVFKPRTNPRKDTIATPVLSSLNGFRMHWSEGSKLRRYIEEACRAPLHERFERYSHLRSCFMAHIELQGVAKGAWDFGKVTRQQKEIAIGVAGTETLKVDAACGPGDTMVADVPWFDATRLSEGLPHLDVYSEIIGIGKGPWGLPQVRRRANKATMAVVPLPRRPSAAHAEAHLNYIRDFYFRGQILGMCQNTNREGKGTADIVIGTCPRLCTH